MGLVINLVNWNLIEIAIIFQFFYLQLIYASSWTENRNKNLYANIKSYTLTYN